jgi:hypothetical protein
MQVRPTRWATQFYVSSLMLRVVCSSNLKPPLGPHITREEAPHYLQPKKSAETSFISQASGGAAPKRVTFVHLESASSLSAPPAQSPGTHTTI